MAPGLRRPARLNVALLALGGYGRKDLFPYSDIDVLFAFADEKTEDLAKESVRGIIQGMWDIGLAGQPHLPHGKGSRPIRPGQPGIHAVHARPPVPRRTVPRLSAASPGHASGLVLSEWNSITQKLSELARARHAKYGNTIFHLEPNLKECPGGLRD